jgi:hypothetical protein
MTSKNATVVTEMNVPVATVPDALHAGFRQLWIEAETGDIHATLFSGAGLGTPYLTLSIEKDGETIYETIDVTDFLEHWITQAIERAEQR